jgi:hypothetical protein
VAAGVSPAVDRRVSPGGSNIDAKNAFLRLTSLFTESQRNSALQLKVATKELPQVYFRIKKASAISASFPKLYRKKYKR